MKHFANMDNDLCMLRVMKSEVKETEKAIGMKIAQGVTQIHQRMIWFPKSMCEIVEEYINEANTELWILIPYWIVKKNVGNSYLLDCDVTSGNDINYSKFSYKNLRK